jgi:hypothetical protein
MDHPASFAADDRSLEALLGLGAGVAGIVAGLVLAGVIAGLRGHAVPAEVRGWLLDELECGRGVAKCMGPGPAFLGSVALAAFAASIAVAIASFLAVEAVRGRGRCYWVLPAGAALACAAAVTVFLVTNREGRVLVPVVLGGCALFAVLAAVLMVHGHLARR